MNLNASIFLFHFEIWISNLQALETESETEIFFSQGASRNSGILKDWYLVAYGTSEPAQHDDSTKQPVPACNLECQNGCTGPRADQCNECKHFKRSTSKVRVP